MHSMVPPRWTAGDGDALRNVGVLAVMVYAGQDPVTGREHVESDLRGDSLVGGQG